MQERWSERRLFVSAAFFYVLANVKAIQKSLQDLDELVKTSCFARCGGYTT